MKRGRIGRKEDFERGRAEGQESEGKDTSRLDSLLQDVSQTPLTTLSRGATKVAKGAKSVQGPSHLR